MPGNARMSQTSVEPFGNQQAGPLPRPKQPAAGSYRNWPVCHAMRGVMRPRQVAALVVIFPLGRRMLCGTLPRVGRLRKTSGDQPRAM